MKRIVVGGRYTYETDLKLGVGDEVELPTPSFLRDVKGPTFTGVVTALTSDYTGWCERVIRVVTKVKKPSKVKKA